MDTAHEPFDGVPPPPLTVIDGVAVTARRLTTRLDRELGVLGLTWAQGRVLLELADAGGMLHAGELGRRLGVTRQAAHRSMASLDRAGHLTWRDDGWVKGARLTDAGRTAAAHVDARAGAAYEAIWRVPAPELHALLRGATSLRRELRRHAPEPAWWMG
jgi:DNA-binding MarR family transcriptional regulator